MKRKEKPFDPHLIELSDKQLEEQKRKEKEQAKKIKHSSWFNKGKY